MKKMLLSITLLGLITIFADAQVKKQEQVNNSKNEYLTMKNGKMMCNMNGKEMPMDKPMKMKNGTNVEMDGTCKLSNGKTEKFHNGQCMDMSGKMYHNREMYQERNLGKQNMGNTEGNMMNNKSQMKEMNMKGGMGHN